MCREVENAWPGPLKERGFGSLPTDENRRPPSLRFCIAGEAFGLPSSGRKILPSIGEREQRLLRRPGCSAQKISARADLGELPALGEERIVLIEQRRPGDEGEGSIGAHQNLSCTGGK